MIDDRLLDALDRLRGTAIEFDGFLANWVDGGRGARRDGSRA